VLDAERQAVHVHNSWGARFGPREDHAVRRGPPLRVCKDDAARKSSDLNVFYAHTRDGSHEGGMPTPDPARGAGMARLTRLLAAISRPCEHQPGQRDLQGLPVSSECPARAIDEREEARVSRGALSVRERRHDTIGGSEPSASARPRRTVPMARDQRRLPEGRHISRRASVTAPPANAPVAAPARTSLG
jgi:hypothetical protein